MIQLNTAFNEHAEGIARYYIVQHMPDPMRRETKNIGVIVQKGDERAARFIGERAADGQIDGRSILQVRDPRLYRMWVRHWRKELNVFDFESLASDSLKNSFGFIKGGEVTDTGSDGPDQICTYLYSMLVTEGGLREAMGEQQDDLESIEIKNDMRTAFKQLGIMKSIAGEGVRYPVFEPHTVRGNKQWHQVSFHQEAQNDEWIMEPLNLKSPQKNRIRERAGYLHYMFEDILDHQLQATKKLHTISVVALDADAANDKTVEWALNAVSSKSRIVNWLNPTERNRFIHDRDFCARS